MGYLTPQLTGNGLAMLINALSGDGIVFSKIVIGNGEPQEDEKKIEAVSNPIIEIGIVSIEKHENYVVIAGKFDNANLESGFYMKELGVLASNSSDGEERLYAYRYSDVDVDYVPNKASGRVVETEISIIVSIGQAENVTAILTEASAYASKEDFQSHIEDYNNPHKVTKEDVGLGSVENLHFNDHTISIDQEAKASNIEDGDKVSTAFGKIMQIIKDYLLHIKADNPHKITPEKIKAAEASHKHSANDLTSGILPISRGGTGATDAYGAAKNILAKGAAGIAGDIYFADFGNSGGRGIYGYMATNDEWRLIGRAESLDNGYVEIATRDNGNDPIILRQYDDSYLSNGVNKSYGHFAHIKRTAYLLDNSGNTVFPGVCSAKSWGTTSDKKMKNDHGEIPVGLAMDLIMGLSGVGFDFKDDDQHRARMGFYAQDVYKLCRSLGIVDSALYQADEIPKKNKTYYKSFLSDEEISKKRDNQLKWSIDYLQLIAPMIVVIQNQEQRIECLEKIIKEGHTWEQQSFRKKR